MGHQPTRPSSLVTVGVLAVLMVVIVMGIGWVILDASSTMNDRFTAECAVRWEGRKTRLIRQGSVSICQVQDRFGWWVPEKQFVVRGEE